MILDTGEAVFSRPKREKGRGDIPPGDGDAYLKSWYGVRTVGMHRWFEAKQAGEQVDTVIRILRPATGTETVWADDICQLCDGWKYRVVQVQAVQDTDSGEDVLDLSLERMART